jgi:hypothetical protein
VTKEEYAALLVDIGGGTPEIGIGARRERLDAEQATLAAHADQFWTLLCLGDAVHQFYRDSLDEMRQQIAATTVDDIALAIGHWHIVGFSRFAATFHLMAHGYYFDAMMLARDLWETALTVAALKKRVVTVGDVLTAGETRRKREQASREVDQRIQQALIIKMLTEAERDTVDTLLGIANLATHKARLHVGANLGRTRRGDPIRLFPHFDLRDASVSYNAVWMATWALLSTLPYLDFAFQANPAWADRYAKVQLALREGPGRGADAVQAWPAIIAKIFE